MSMNTDSKMPQHSDRVHLFSEIKGDLKTVNALKLNRAIEYHKDENGNKFYWLNGCKTYIDGGPRFQSSECPYRPDIHDQGWFKELEQRHGMVTVPEIESGKYDEFIRQWKEDHEDTKS